MCTTQPSDPVQFGVSWESNPRGGPERHERSLHIGERRWSQGWRRYGCPLICGLYDPGDVAHVANAAVGDVAKQNTFPGDRSMLDCRDINGRVVISRYKAARITRRCRWCK
jgi:hypothetical protein